MRHRIELRDRDMEFINVLDDRAENLKWGFDPVGGCGEFSFRASSKWCTELDLGANFNVRVYLRNEATKNYTLVYQGRIETTSINIQHPETIEVGGFGYQSELRDIVFNNSYSSQEISVIVKHILDNYVVPNTNITYSLADLETTGITLDSIDFEYATAQEAFEKLADIDGGVEFGVDKDRKFYFKQKTSTVGFRYVIGSKKVLGFTMGSSSREIKNSIIVLGGKVAGTTFVYTEDYAQSQLKYKKRYAVVQNSGVTTNSVANQLADAYQAAHNGTLDRGKIKIQDGRIFETSLPMNRLEVITREVLFDEKEFDTFLWAGQEPFEIRRIGYELDTNLNLIAELELGAPLPDIVEAVKALEFNLSQVTQRG